MSDYCFQPFLPDFYRTPSAKTLLFLEYYKTVYGLLSDKEKTLDNKKESDKEKTSGNKKSEENKTDSSKSSSEDKNQNNKVSSSSKKLADAKGKTVEEIKAICESLHEFNPMMGHRGCRLAVTYPSIAKMQTKAVIRAAIEVQKAHPDWNVKPEIMIPLVCDVKELKQVKAVVVKTADEEICFCPLALLLLYNHTINFHLPVNVRQSCFHKSGLCSI